MKINTKKSGMTLIEIMVSVLIVAILAAGMFAVGSYSDTQIKIKRTEATIQILVAALEQYNDFYREFPDPNAVYPVGLNDNDANGSIERLYYKLTLAPDAKKILDQINRKSIKDSDSDKNPEVVDAWDKSLRYSYIDGWNFPVIISAGPDKKMSTKEDNISSKKL